jgi:hypothetical protein
VECIWQAPACGWHPRRHYWSSVVSLNASLCPLLFGVHETTYDCQIVAGDCLIFFSFFLSHISDVYYCPFCFLLFNLSPHSINFLFHSFSIYRSFYYF